jgi:imidazolonepropionase-like amidohydrolase
MMVERGTYWVPSMKVLDAALGISAGSVPAGALDAELTKGVHLEWQNLAKMLPVANDAGVKIITGDDYGVPIVPHVPGIYSTELTTYVKQVGIAPLDTLRWATRNVADLLQMGHELGTVAPDALADLIVVDGDPSVDITVLEDPLRTVLAVMKDGEFYKNRLTAATVAA